jgi:hypothetical protein
VQNEPTEGIFMTSIRDSGEYYFNFLLNNCQSGISYYLSSINTTLEDTLLSSDTMMNQLSNIETSILENSDLTDTAKSFPLAFVAMAKYSLAYWRDTSNCRIWLSFCNDSSGFSQTGCLLKIAKNKEESKAHKVVKTDATYGIGTAIGTGIVGAVAGFLFGTPAGPLGAAAGTASGAASGFILGSASGIAVGASASVIKFIEVHTGGQGG